jgi:hypothetical protein
MKLVNKLTFGDDDAVRDESLSNGIGIPVFHVKTFHKLNQIVGYAKYINRLGGNIYFRGQSELYSACFPGLGRDIKSSETYYSRRKKLTGFLDSVKKQIPLTSSFDDVFVEPLMQHYGIRTKWIDLVDNVWEALWFGLHEYNSVQNKEASSQTNPYIRDYVHVARRWEGDLYILLIHSDATESIQPGYFIGEETELVDLRIGCPSIFLRPHAQHGLLACSRSGSLENHNFYRRTVGIVRVAVSDALEWIGSGNLLTHANMYPSPVYDFGYRFMLDALEIKNEDRSIFGTIKVYTLS